MKRMREPLKRWEKSLIALSMALFLGALTLYVSDFPLRNYL